MNKKSSHTLASMSFIGALVLVGSLAVVTPAQAETASPTVRAQRLELRQENAEERQELRQENREERQELRQENRQERRDLRSEAIGNRVSNRFSRHNQRLENWINRASQHISQKTSQGKNMDAALVALNQARASLTEAKDLGNTAVEKLRAVEPEAWSEQKADALEARQAVKAAQQAYAKVVQELKAVVVELKKAN